ncbi:MAG: hypothetical protein P8188_08915 [Gemmatimonadota bacterium]
MALLLGCAVPLAGSAQQQESAYLRSVAIHFGYTAGEVMMLAEWDVPVAEVPVALTVARDAGVSAAAVMALRQNGRAWADLLVRYGLHAGRLYVPLDEPPTEGAGGDAYAAYASRDPGAWRVIRLTDESIVYLVNLEFLSDHLELPPQAVADVLTAEGSPVRAHHRLLRARTP